MTIGSVGIVGTGLAGVTVAQALRRNGFEGRIVLFGDEPHHAYDRPSLSKAALVDSLAVPIPICEDNWQAVHRVELRTTAVTGIDPLAGEIIGSDAVVTRVDRIVLATGARANTLGIPGVECEGVLTLRTWQDMEALRARLGPDVRLAIIGGGLIGCEVATSARKLGCDVTLFEAAPELLERVLGRDIGGLCREGLERLGVKVIVGAQVAAIEGGVEVAGVRCADGHVELADVVLCCVGGTPADELARAAGVACDRGVTVNAVGRSSADRLFAVGDAASWPLVSGSRRSLETYLNAQAQAECVARALVGDESPQPQLPKGWTDIAGRKIQIVGDMGGPGSVVSRRLPDAELRFLIDTDGSLRGALAVDAPGDFAAAMRLVDRGARPDADELADPDVSLRDLVKKHR